VEVIEVTSQLIREDAQIEMILNANSAEAKTIKPINEPINNDEWIVVDDLDQNIDMEVIKTKFKERGYKS
jgi:hypothetical protein